jgi:hypothetical protein
MTAAKQASVPTIDQEQQNMMYVYGTLREQLVRQCSEKWQGQYQPGSTKLRVWRKLSPEHIIDLLASAAFDARQDARDLLRQMQQRPWRILATVHVGGFGGQGRGSDHVPHVTLQVNGINYHLRCRETPSLHVFQITR